MKLSRSSFSYLRRHKRWVVIALSLIIVAIGFMYGLWSIQQWNQYQPAYAAERAAIQASLDGLSSRVAVTSKDKTAIRNDLTEVSQAIDTFESKVCQVNGLAAWQGSVVKSLQEERDECREQAVKMTELSVQLERVVAFLEDDQEVAEQLSKAPQAEELADTAWQAQVAAWQSISDVLKERTASKDYKPTQQLVAQKTQEVAGAWQGVIVAHESKDKQKFTAAQDSLAKAYDGLDVISTETTKVLTNLAKVVEEKYQTAF